MVIKHMRYSEMEHWQRRKLLVSVWLVLAAAIIYLVICCTYLIHANQDEMSY